MENLTKENFWNEMQEQYPKAMKIFCDWIDKYKQKNNWDDLFGNKNINQRDHYWSDIKFHHVPLAFQIGVCIEFFCERDAFFFYSEGHSFNDWKEEIQRNLLWIEQEEMLKLI